MGLNLGEVFDPSIANVDSRIVRSRLNNGMRVAVLNKKSANSMVTGSIELRFGDSTSLTNQREAAAMAGSLLMHGKWVRHLLPWVEKAVYFSKLPKRWLTPPSKSPAVKEKSDLVQIETPR